MELNQVNELFPYIGAYESSGLDPKNRLTILTPIRDIRKRRTQAFEYDNCIWYYSLSKDNDISFLLLQDYFAGKEDFPSFFSSSLDSQHRLRLERTVADLLPSRKDLMMVGYGSHVRIYSRQDWENLQTK